ncbi:LysR family transcriptional regulator [Stappia sp. BW2]|nr:LysR family transcriptional regulator [Stappia sp. BW2]
MKLFSNISGLLAFTTVAREGSVSRAAEVLNLTQPAVSHQLKRLAEETGTTLFRRTSRGLELSNSGAELLAKAEQVLEALAEFRRSAQQGKGSVSGTLRIGTIVDPEFIRLGPLLRRLRADYPGITTELTHGVSGEVLARLMRGSIDAGFYLSNPDKPVLQQNEEKLHTVRLADFAYRVIAPPGWQAQVETAGWEALAELPWIGTPPASAHYRLLDEIFTRHNCRQNIVALVDQEASMLEMVRAGVGLSLCRESIALHQRQAFGIAVGKAVSVPACLGFATMNRHLGRDTIAALLDSLQEIWIGK